jgi:ribA/ribD-fused uncharacterized protein
MWTRDRLAERLARGESVDFLFFWGHTPEVPRRVDASCLSQWFPCTFHEDGVRYPTAEHYMMAAKARLFGDAEALRAILVARTPADAKALGRGVRHYDDAAWSQARGEAVVRGNVLKFGQSPELGAFLCATGERILVEASPRDRVWGIGMGASNPDARHPARWRGQNLLGFALMEARARLVGLTTARQG